MAARPTGAAAGAGTHYQGKTMADKIVGREVNPNPNSGIPIRMKDMGDGTFAEVISSSGGGGGGGGAVTVADGADVAQGTTTDAAAASDGATGTVLAFLKRISARLTAVITQLTTNVVVSATAGTTASSTAYATSLVGKASAGTLFAVSIYNSSTSAQFYQLHDAASLPANTAVPKSIIRIPAQGTGGWDFGLRGRPFATGIVIANSSTGPTLTVGSADSYFDAVVA